MKTIKYTPDGSIHWLELPLPTPSSEELLVSVKAIGVNRADILQRQGLYPIAKGENEIPGLEISGIVELSNSPNFKIGDAVCGIVEGGAYAEHAVIRHTQAFKIPDGMDFVQAASLPEALFTCWLNLFQIGGLQPSQRVLIHGGASGIGVIAIQLCKAFGAEVIVTAGSDAKCNTCTQLGADNAINYKTSDFSAIPDKVDLIMDIAGASNISKNLKIISRFGRIIIISLLGQRTSEVDFGKVLTQNIQIIGSTLRPRSAEYKANICNELKQKVIPMLGKSIKPVIYATFPFSEVAKAHEIMQNNINTGKIVLSV